MQWGQIKTLLILSFFILDIYLLVQFLEKKDISDVAIQQENASSIEEQLKNDGITYDNLPEDDLEESFISVKEQYLDDALLKKASFGVKQDQYILNNSMLLAKLDKPEKIGKDADRTTIKEKISKIAYKTDDYSYWDWNKEWNVIIYFQNKMDRTVYFNQNGLILFFLNDDNEIEYYVQTVLGEAEKINENQKLIDPMRAIETIYNENYLHPDDTIESVRIGFHTRVPVDSGVQVFAPIWKVNVNNEYNYFVNAIEGYLFSTEEIDFLEETAEDIHEKAKGEKVPKFVEEIDEKLELLEEETDKME